MTNNKTVENKRLEKFASFWENKSKNGNVYFSGRYEGSNKKLVAFVNRDKTNPKEPDLRIYDGENTKKEVLALWCNVTKDRKKKYFSGKQDGTRYVGFYYQTTENKRPNLVVNREEIVEGLNQGKAEDFEITEDNDLPF